MEFLLILLIIPLTIAGLAFARQHRENRDAALTETSGGWRIRSQLDLDAGPPYSYFNPDLALMMPHDVMEGTEEGFEVSYFTIEDGGGRQQRIQRPAAIVQLPVEGPRFRYLSSDIDDEAPRVLAGLRQGTPAHYSNGTPGRIGPKAAEVLELARGVIVETAPYTVFIRSKGARPEMVSRLAMQLAKALVEDAKAGA